MWIISIYKIWLINEAICQAKQQKKQSNWENCEINVLNFLIPTKYLIVVETVRSGKDQQKF